MVLTATCSVSQLIQCTSKALDTIKQELFINMLFLKVLKWSAKINNKLHFKYGDINYMHMMLHLYNCQEKSLLRGDVWNARLCLKNQQIGKLCT